MTKLTPALIKTARDYLRPMQTPTNFFITEDGGVVSDIAPVADAIREHFPEAITVGFGGCVSSGRLADSLLDEYLDDSVGQTIIVEVYENDSHNQGLNDLLNKAITQDLHRDSVVIFISAVPISQQVISRCVAVEIDLSKDAALA